MTSAQSQHQAKREGDISDSFMSLSGGSRPPLPERFLDLKRSLVAGHEDRVIASWQRLLARLKEENGILAKDGSKVIPSVEFSNLEKDLARLHSEIKKRGVAVIRGVIPEEDARAYKDDIEEYVRQNPSTRGRSHARIMSDYLSNLKSSFPTGQSSSIRAVLVKPANSS
ncbi:hypothetical protein ANO14919_121450 [Xylariales sp. No.14919]|nr:hypothetical protein ANO14919_121450 [Xylariales sp. No.14919]